MTALAASKGHPATHSRFVQRVRRRYADQLSLLAPGVVDAAAMHRTLESLHAQGRDFAAALRVLRHLVLERLAVRDLEQSADLNEVTHTMTLLAEVTLDLALQRARQDESLRHGTPRNASGAEIEFWILGMGKLGGRELNVSSDIDLIYVYDEDGMTDGRDPVTAHEYFGKVAKRLYALIGETTDDGFVFRVDLALRPNGKSGPIAVSLAMLEEYFLVQGREWERFAWLKSRLVAPLSSIGQPPAQHLRQLVAPFVYRRYLDYGVFEGLRQLHLKIREEAQRRAAGRPERANDVKLSRGGIREIEFIVQLLLVVRGGQFPEIRTRSTLRALERLVAHGMMSQDTATRLADAYRFLRRVEHRIQYLDDQQTHALPSAQADLDWIAATLAREDSADGAALLRTLGDLRDFVAQEFDALLDDGRGKGGDPNNHEATPLPVDSESFIAELPPGLAERVREWASQPRVQSLRTAARLMLARLLRRAADDVLDGSCSLDAALRFIDWVDPLLRREAYLALLSERAEVHKRLLHLLGLARWPMRYLMRHPGVIDELADERLLHERFDAASYMQDLEQRHQAWVRSGEASEESVLDMLRHAHHAVLFRTLVRDVVGPLTVEQVADDLSSLADATLALVLRWAWEHLKQRHRPSPQLAVIAYGKLGGKELGYGSDLDLVFLYDDDDERASEIYAALVRKLITWLTLRTAAGELFEIDTALRPNGNSGLLVTSMAAFAQYQKGRGSNTAWTWEHQAITRARACAGDAAIAERFESVRQDVMRAPRDTEALRAEVATMRAKLRAARPVKAELFDVKHSAGGMVDVEFAVQYLVLRHAAVHPELLENRGNITLLARAEDAGLLPPGVGRSAADAYRELRRAQHQARLDERATLFDPELHAQARHAVLTLWQQVFG